MNSSDQLQISLIVGMLYSLACAYESHFNDDEKRLLTGITADIDRIYYPKPDNTLPAFRGKDNG
jgi:hypothetical protein